MLYPIAAATAFNLVCTGTVTTVMYTEETKPYRSVYRLDLDAGTWCEGECRSLFDFPDVSPIQITFEDMIRDEVPGQTKVENFVNRETGAHYAHVWSTHPAMKDMSMSWSGSCEKADFTGFPEFETKF